MTELERWMNDHPPLADALTAEETAALRPKSTGAPPEAPGFARLAAGSRGGSALLSGRGRGGAGAFPPHERRQRDERTGAEIRRGAGRTADRRDQRPHGQCKGAAARRRTRCGCCTMWITRKGWKPNDLVWDTGEFYAVHAQRTTASDKRLYSASNARGTGRCSGYAVGSWDNAQCSQARATFSPALWIYLRCTEKGHRHANAVYRRPDKLTSAKAQR